MSLNLIIEYNPYVSTSSIHHRFLKNSYVKAVQKLATLSIMFSLAIIRSASFPFYIEPGTFKDI